MKHKLNPSVIDQPTKDFYTRFDSLMQDVMLKIEELLNGEIVSFEENGFEDDSSNDLAAIGPEGLYDSDEEGKEPIYPLHELSFEDAMMVIDRLYDLKNLKP